MLCDDGCPLSSSPLGVLLSANKGNLSPSVPPLPPLYRFGQEPLELCDTLVPQLCAKVLAQAHINYGARYRASAALHKRCGEVTPLIAMFLKPSLDFNKILAIQKNGKLCC